MKLIGSAIILVAGCLASLFVAAGDLAGFWKNDEHPAWIEIQFEGDTATGTVRRNQEYPDRVGRIVLKDIASDADNPGNWRGQVYAERLKEFKEAEISMPNPDSMQIKVKVGFMNRTVGWTRAAELPKDES